MSYSSEFITEPLDFTHGYVLSVEARAPRAGSPGLIELRFEGSEDQAAWAELRSGSTADRQRVVVSCGERVAPWGGRRVWTFDGGASVSVRRFPGERE